MTIAVVDIGTNTVLLLIAAIDAKGHITPLAYEQRIPRLGKGVDASKRLRIDAMERAAAVLKDYAPIIERHRPIRTVLCATSAVRDAENRQEFVDLLRERVGFDLEVLSGEDEALWTYRGAISGIPGSGRAAVLDIGGGSTELTVGDRLKPAVAISLDVGSVRLTERLLRSDPPAPEEISQARFLVRDSLRATTPIDTSDAMLIAVAGTATALAILDQGLPEFSINAVSGHVMKRSAVRHIFDRLRTMTVGEIRGLSSVMEGRADVIVAGALILCEVMDFHRFDQVIVSERGVRYGIALREWEELSGGKDREGTR